MIVIRYAIALAAAATLLTGCAREARTLASDQPQTPPDGPSDPRAARYDGNYYQVSQGGLYFTWYGCSGCHGTEAKGALDLSDGRWLHGGTIDAVYASIATGHPVSLARYGERIPVEQLWQISAFVRDLARNDPAKNRRGAFDQQGQPQGDAWRGPVQ
jgi:mono/diheme cytochrome c family protein